MLARPRSRCERSEIRRLDKYDGLMSSAYETLKRTGFVARVKRDVVVEASEDIAFLIQPYYAFLNAGEQARENALECSVQLIGGLVADGLCKTATWAPIRERKIRSAEDIEIIALDRKELEAAIKWSVEQGNDSFRYFLVATEAGKGWTQRYFNLLDEL